MNANSLSPANEIGAARLGVLAVLGMAMALFVGVAVFMGGDGDDSALAHLSPDPCVTGFAGASALIQMVPEPEKPITDGEKITYVVGANNPAPPGATPTPGATPVPGCDAYQIDVFINLPPATDSNWTFVCTIPLLPAGSSANCANTVQYFANGADRDGANNLVAAVRVMGNRHNSPNDCVLPKDVRTPSAPATFCFDASSSVPQSKPNTPTNTATNTPTHTPTNTATSTNTATPTRPSTATPTRPVGKVGTKLELNLRQNGQKIQCEGSGIHRKCRVLVTKPFTVSVLGIDTPRTYTLYQVVLQFTPGINVINREGMTESKIPCLRGSRELVTSSRYEMTCSVATFQRPFLGGRLQPLVNVDFTCKPGIEGTQQIDIVGGKGGPKISLFVSPSNQTGSANVYAKWFQKPGSTKRVSDAILVNCATFNPG